MIRNKLQLIEQITQMNDEEFATLQKLLNGESIRTPAATVATPKSNDLYHAITDCMLDHGFTANLKGYNYIRTALMTMITEPKVWDDQITVLYKVVGERHSTTGSRSERAIRHAITRAYELHPDRFAEEFASHAKAPT